MANPTSFADAARRGDLMSALRQSVVYASLWAIGSSWALAIREVVTSVVPNRGVAEILAATVTTLLAIGITFAALCERESPS